ncbi:MAG: aldehyde dehydrogenase family protein [Phycisphaeraceae bacterium]|nr:aldehyde dehydrogenase family protein [Phycisphaeraceae bacterium]
MTTSADAVSVLTHEPCALIGGEPRPIPGDAIRSHDPSRPASIIWSGSPDLAHVDAAIAAARSAQRVWARTPRSKRIEALRRYQEIVRSRVDEIARLINAETGKAMWEAAGEASILAAKVDVTLDESEHAGMSRVRDYEITLSDTRRGICRYRPHGVMAVVGPFNFPAHLPNGHIIPALAMGDTVVFKPSDKTPAIGQLIAEMFNEALESVGAPPGVVNLVQGAGDVAGRLVAHHGVDGVLFTGSWPVGRKILEANLDSPGKIVALELGGNNPCIVMDDADLRQAAIECVRASFATTGQRCTCTRRIILHEKIADRFIPAIVNGAQALDIGDPRREAPVFYGPLIRERARQEALSYYESLVASGGEGLIEPRAIDDIEGCEGGHFISPGAVRVDRFVADDAGGPGRDSGCDIEVFGPIVRVCVVKSYEEAIEQANATRYGLAAAIFTKSRETGERFLLDARAGCVNVNAGTAGASGKLPFGGLGWSGNHRPAGSSSVDYCAYPVASMVETSDAAPLSPGMTFEDSWLR